MLYAPAGQITLALLDGKVDGLCDELALGGELTLVWEGRDDAGRVGWRGRYLWAGVRRASRESEESEQDERR